MSARVSVSIQTLNKISPRRIDLGFLFQVIIDGLYGFPNITMESQVADLHYVAFCCLSVINFM